MTKSRGLRTRRGIRQAWAEANEGQHLCRCGCGEVIEVKFSHFNTGIPQYRLGHNPQQRKPKPPRLPCECGCGELAGPGKQYVTGHNRRGQTHTPEARRRLSEAKMGERNPQHGKTPHNYKGGRGKSSGYITVLVPDHPMAAKNGRVMEHRLVVEEGLRVTDPESPFLVEVDGEMYLRLDVDVHHRDHNRANNDPANLEPMWSVDHVRKHATGRKQPTLTHCKHGHEFTEENTYLKPDGYRACRECVRRRSAEQNVKRRENRRASR